MASHVQDPWKNGENSFIEWKGNWESHSNPIVHGFPLAKFWSLSLDEFLPGKKTNLFFSLLGSAVVIGHESFTFWSPDPILLRFLFIGFLHFLLLISIFLWKYCWSRVRFSALFDISHSKILYDLPSRVMEIKAKINKWDLIKLN